MHHVFDKTGGPPLQNIVGLPTDSRFSVRRDPALPTVLVRTVFADANSICSDGSVLSFLCKMAIALENQGS